MEKSSVKNGRKKRVDKKSTLKKGKKEFYEIQKIISVVLLYITSMQLSTLL